MILEVTTTGDVFVIIEHYRLFSVLSITASVQSVKMYLWLKKSDLLTMVSEMAFNISYFTAAQKSNQKLKLSCCDKECY